MLFTPAYDVSIDKYCPVKLGERLHLLFPPQESVSSLHLFRDIQIYATYHIQLFTQDVFPDKILY